MSLNIRDRHARISICPEGSGSLLELKQLESQRSLICSLISSTLVYTFVEGSSIAGRSRDGSIQAMSAKMRFAGYSFFVTVFQRGSRMNTALLVSPQLCKTISTAKMF
ncbi:hypothetical protein GALL_365210 [mine drainage metagenome]|uniref:Uncharacterized protein n=1 Tax=mine drainage metagenome TaxID=410659 RepID=A0A1J5QP46_9ZZZZ